MNWQPLNLASPKYDKPSEPPAICGLLYIGKRHVLSGPPEAAKTLLALVHGLEQMRAGLGPFAFLDFEGDPASVRLLLGELGASHEEIGAVHYVQPEGPPELGDIDGIEAAGVTLVIIDAAAGAYAVTNLDDNKRLDAERFASTWVRPLWERGLTTLLIDHVVKNGDSRGGWAIGSERKLGQADVHLGLTAVTALSRGGEGLIRVATHKDRPGHLRRPVAAEVELRSDPVTHAITWTIRPASASADSDEWKPTALMNYVCDYLSKHPEGASRNEIEKNVRGKSNRYKRQALDELITLGKVVESLGPRGAKIAKLATSPDLAPTSPGEVASDLAHLARPLQGGEARGEDDDSHGEDPRRGEVEDELDRLLRVHADVAERRGQ